MPDSSTAHEICPDNWDFSYAVYDYFIPISHALAAITLMYPFYLYCRAYTKDELKSSKQLFAGTIIMFIACIGNFVFIAIGYPYLCHQVSVYEDIGIIHISFYFIQAVLLLQILFYRAYTVFDNTEYALTRYHVIFWIVFTIFYTIIYIMATFLLYGFTETADLGFGLIAFYGLLSIIANIWLVVVYVGRLVKLHKLVSGEGLNHSAKSNKLMALATKTTLLCFISAFMYMMTVFLAPALSFRTAYSHLLMLMITFVDVYTSFFCIFLTFSRFSSWYNKICTPGHNACNACCAKCCGIKQNKGMDIVKQMTVDGSIASATNGTKTETSQITVDQSTTNQETRTEASQTPDSTDNDKIEP